MRVNSSCQHQLQHVLRDSSPLYPPALPTALCYPSRSPALEMMLAATAHGRPSLPSCWLKKHVARYSIQLPPRLLVLVSSKHSDTARESRQALASQSRSFPPSLTFKRAHSINHKQMRDQLPHIAQHACLQKPNSPRPRIRIPILEPDVDLLRPQLWLQSRSPRPCIRAPSLTPCLPSHPRSRICVARISLASSSSICVWGVHPMTKGRKLTKGETL